MSGKRHLGLKEVAAAKLAVEALEKRQCRDVFWATSQGASAVLTTSDRSRLPVRVFHQLDQELFRGVLRGQVCLSSLPNFHPSIHGATRRAGHPYGRVTILLNPSIIISERPEVIVATLIHHMAHAYFLVCCGYGDGEDQHDLKHGLPISTLLHTIKARFLPNNRFFPELFRCTDNLGRHTAVSSFGQHAMEGHSYCSWHCTDYQDFPSCLHYLHYTLRPLKLDSKEDDDEEGPYDVEKHYPRSDYLHIYCPDAAVLDPIPRSQYERRDPPNTFIEFHYQGKAIPLNVVNLRYWPKFRASLVENELRIVKIPPDVGAKAFRSVLSFAICGSYEPVWTPDGGTVRGPPKIDTGSGNVSETGPSVPAEDFRVYAVAQTIGFEELRQHTLRRLYSQSLLKSDAMEFVEEVYTGKEPGKDKPVACGKGWKPDRELREFMMAFLSAEHPDRRRIEVEVDEYGQIRPVGSARLEDWRNLKQTNLGLLQGSKWKEKLGKLRSGGGIFLEDLDKVEENMRQGMRVEQPAFVGSGWHAPLLLQSPEGRLDPGHGYGTEPQATLGYPVAPGVDEVMVGDQRRTHINRPEATHLETARHVAARSDFGVGDLGDNFKYTQPSGRW